MQICLKKFSVPLPQTVENNKLVNTYSSILENLSLLQWLREVDATKKTPTLYQKGNTLVGTRLCSVFKDEYFFQDILLNVPHRSTNKFTIPNSETIPDTIKYIVCALHHRASLWMSGDNMTTHFNLEGHRSWYISN